MRKSRNKVFMRGFSHENLMRLSWAFNAREKNEIFTSEKAHEKISWECHFLMRISWESHEILMSFQFSWEKWDSHEQKTSWEILMRFGKFSWECHFLMRISWDSHENSKTHENVCKGGRSQRTVDISVVARPLTPLQVGASHLDRYFYRIRSLFRQHFFAAPAWIILFVCFLLSCPCVVLDKHISFYGFFSTAPVCTCTQHDDTFQQEKYQSTSRLKNADEKNSNKRNSLLKRNWHLFRPRPELLFHTLSPIWHPGDSPMLCGSTHSWMHVYPILRKSPAWSSSWKTTELRSSSVFWLFCCSTWHAASSSHATDLQAYAYAPSSS